MEKPELQGAADFVIIAKKITLCVVHCQFGEAAELGHIFPIELLCIERAAEQVVARECLFSAVLIIDRELRLCVGITQGPWLDCLIQNSGSPTKRLF